MSTRIVAQNFNSSQYFLGYVKRSYPSVTNVRACMRLRSDDDGPNEGVIRRRSRGTHQPGSGPYQCSFIYAPGGLTGWIAGTTLYVYTCPKVSGYSGDNVWWEFEKTPSSMSDTVAKHTTNHRTQCQRYRYVVPTISGSVVTWTYFLDTFSSTLVVSLEYAASHMTIGTTPRTQRWATGTTVSTRLGDPKPEVSHLGDAISNDCIPNMAAFRNAAFVDAYNHLPAITNNNVETLIEVFSILKAIVTAYGTGDISSVASISQVGSLSDAWLGYRYSYGTTKMDIEEIAGYIDRVRSLARASSVRAHGSYTFETQTESYLVKCSIEVPKEDITGIYSTLERLGLALDGYNAWDLIPYSFVVDWFLHIGDLLEKARSRRYAMRLHPTRIWFSVTHDYTNANGCHQCDYYRWSTNGLDDRLATLPANMLSHNSSSGVTWVKRGLDAVCLLS